MAFIIYSAISPEGTTAWRSGNYDSLDALWQELERRGERIDRFYELPAFLERLVEALRGTIRPAQVVEICNYLSLYVQGGLDLQTALADLARGSREGAVRGLAERMRRDLMAGHSLSGAMERSRQFPEVVLNMAQIGEGSGNLPTMLADAAAYMERIEEIKSTTKRALIYPAFTLTMLLLTTVFWMLFVVPKLAAVYKSMDVELPWPTRFLMAMSDAFASGWTWGVLALVSVPLLISVARRWRGLRPFIDRLAWDMPIFGNVVRNSQSAFFFQYFALVYRAGVPVVEAVSGLVETAQNRYFRARIRRIPEYLRIGVTLREAFQRCNVFQTLDVRMIGIGEQTGSLDAQLSKLAGIYMNRVRVAVELLTKAIEPLLVLVMGVFFVFFVIALLAPIYELVANMMSQIGAQ